MSHVDRTGCAATRHGTASAYRHGRRCLDAREGHRLYNKRVRERRNPPGQIDPAPSARRIQALIALGWPPRDLAVRLGRTSTTRNMMRVFRAHGLHPATANAITRVYAELSGTPGPSEVTRHRARKGGYRPPLDWDDIDAGIIAPATTSTDREVDEMAVLRAVTGHPPAKLRRVDRLAAIAELTDDGMYSTDIAKRLRCGVDRVRTDRKTLRSQREVC